MVAVSTLPEQRLSFGTLEVIAPQIFEVIVDEGVEMNLRMVGEYHAALNQLRAGRSYRLLVNKRNTYTYTFEAQQALLDLAGLEVCAVVAETAGGTLGTRSLLSVGGHGRPLAYEVRLFSARAPALEWLKSCAPAKSLS